MCLYIRRAERSEVEWINERYREVGFIPSHLDKEIVGIAELDEKKAGLGRLVTIDEKHLELGGIYVFEPFRNKGIARHLVQFLLEHVNRSITYGQIFHLLILASQTHNS